MEKLQARGVKHTGIRHNSVVTASWLVKMKKLRSRGEQNLTDEKNAARRADPRSRELGKLLGLMAPFIVHVHSVRDSSALTETWRETTTPMRAGALDDAATVCCREYSSVEMLQTAAALSQTNTNRLSLYLEAFPNGDKADFTQGGSFMSSLVCGRPTCRSNVGVPPLERKARLEHLAVVYETVYTFRNGAILSAFADATSIDRLTLVKAANDKHDACLEPSHWGWLAYALWSRTSTVSIPALRLSPMDLTEELVSATEAALQTSYPQPEEGSAASMYGYVDIPQGTELRPISVSEYDDEFWGSEEEEDAEDTEQRPSGLVLVLSRDCRCRAYYDPSSMGNQANVVVPGYGICQVELEGGAIKFVSDEASDDVTMQEAAGSGGVRSLIADFWRLQDGALVTRLLRLIGGNLKSLALDFSETSGDVEVDLSEVAVACPKLEQLRLDGCNASISTHNEALRNWGIKKLEIYESRAVEGLETLLRDQSYRTARELVELAFSAPPDRMNEHFYGFSYHGMPTEDNSLLREYVNALLAHRGELVIKEKLPVRSKLAMLSVVRAPDSSLRSVQYMDASILSRIFAFAAVPAQRSVYMCQ